MNEKGQLEKEVQILFSHLCNFGYLLPTVGMVVGWC